MRKESPASHVEGIVKNSISEVTRRNIFDRLRAEGVVWHGRLEEIDFLYRIFDLDNMPSYDERFSNAADDIWQHRINNYDWRDDYWVFSDERFNLLNGNDEIFLRFLCEMIHPVVRGDKEETEKLRPLFNELLAADGFEVVGRTSISGRPVFAARKKISAVPSSVKSARDLIKTLDAGYMSQQITRLEAAISSDPELAIGTAKEFLESCCKTILNERSQEIEKNVDLTKLVKLTCKQLKLTPDDIPDSVKAADVIKRLLSNLGSVADGMAEIRNKYGTGHGKSASTKGLGSRHARLAVGAATTLAIFLFETHRETKEAAHARQVGEKVK
ncbi:MAG: abortive infection family protein [bacterium]